MPPVVHEIDKPGQDGVKVLQGAHLDRNIDVEIPRNKPPTAPCAQQRPPSQEPRGLWVRESHEVLEVRQCRIQEVHHWLREDRDTLDDRRLRGLPKVEAMPRPAS